jgi:UDP-3-O-[3-hydroxymyristoyl] N-acetylglucosamine deacetylase
MTLKRRTIAQPVTALGLGVRTGKEISISLQPGDSGLGLRLRRTDLGCETPVNTETVTSSAVCTAVGSGEARVDFVEHLLAALHAKCISDILIEVSGGEVPMFDGSARPFWQMLQHAGTADHAEALRPMVVRSEILIGAGEKLLRALPADAPSFEYALSHPHPMVGEQSATYDPSADDFALDLAPARTWGLYEELAALRAAGLLAGGSEENAIVVSADHLSAPLAWPNAFARHKLLDLYGDLYLLGAPVIGRISAARTGHADNHLLAKAIADQQ